MDASEFWSCTNYLKHIQQFAHSRRVAPYALLGAAIGMRLASLPPNWQLPAMIGSYGSLNTFIGLVAESGGGKTTAVAAARDLIFGDDGVGDVPTVEPGSGEALAHLYMSREGKGDPVWLRRSVVAAWDEISTLGSASNRSGATMMSKLCSAFMGEELGSSHVDKAKSLPLGRHSYRLVILAGVQESRSNVLLNESGVGLPQRFLFMPAVDPEMPERRADDPGPLNLCLSLDPRQDDPDRLLPRRVVDVDEDAEKAVLNEQLRKVRGEEADSLDAHALLIRLKVAAGLSLLESGREEPIVSPMTWALAGHLLDVSRSTREAMKERLRSNRRDEAMEAGKQEAEKMAARKRAEVDVEKRDTRLDAWTLKAVDSLIDKGKKATPGEVRRKAPSRDRGFISDCIERLLAEGRLDTNEADELKVVRLQYRDRLRCYEE